MTSEELKAYYLSLDHDTIEDGSIVINQNVDISHKHLESLYCGLIIAEVDGDFKCNYNLLGTLEGAPKIVNGTFDCDSNYLTTLEGAPKLVNNFECHDNMLTNLHYLPRTIRGELSFERNPLDFEGLIPIVMLTAGIHADTIRWLRWQDFDLDAWLVKCWQYTVMNDSNRKKDVPDTLKELVFDDKFGAMDNTGLFDSFNKFEGYVR